MEQCRSTELFRDACRVALLLIAASPLAACRAQAADAAPAPLSPATIKAAPARPLTKRLPAVSNAGRNFPTQQASALLSQQAEALLPPAPPEPPAPLPESVAPGTLESTGITLDDITGIALANSPLVREARNQWLAAQGRALQASFYPNPTIGNGAPQLAGLQSQVNGYVGQEIVTKGKIRLDTAAAEREAYAAEMSLIRARFDLLTMVRKRFFTALAMQRRVEVLDQMVGIARRSHEISERLLKAGVGPRSDVLLLQIELSKAEAELRNAHTLAETSRRELAAATGLVDLVINRVAGDLQQPLPDYDLAATQQAVLERNALVRRAQFEVARWQFLLRRAEVEPWPNIDMMGGYQRQQPGNGFPLDQGMYQVQIVLPLYNQNQGNIRAAQATIGSSVAAFNRVRTELANETALAVGNYITARQFADRYRTEILPAAVDVQRITGQLYNQGQVEFLRYLASQRALLDANLAYISAQLERWHAGAELAGLLQSEQFP